MSFFSSSLVTKNLHIKVKSQEFEPRLMHDSKSYILKTIMNVTKS